MSDMATWPKVTNAGVVASTSPPASAVRRSKRSVPSQSVARSMRRAATAGTTRAAPAVGPSQSWAKAISQ